MSHIRKARAQFEENWQMFSRKAPENHNLYAGLLNLAKAIEEVQDDLNRIKQFLAATRR